MAVSYNDKYQLAQSPLFQHRVQASLVAAALAIQAESALTVPLHPPRADLARSILLGPTGNTNYVVLFCNAVACDTNVINDATATGATAITAANMDAQQASVTDAHIDAAISSTFNAFCAAR
jgi:hypothetical protein